MRAFLKRRAEAIQVVLGVVVTALAAAELVGKPVRLVQLITLGAGMFAAGMGVGGMVARRRARRPDGGGGASGSRSTIR